jgi:hypothetical protein
VNQHDRADHVERETEGGQPGEEPDDEGNSTKEFKQCDEWAHDTWHWDTHLGKTAADAGETENKELLPTVRDEHDPQCHAQNQERNVYLTACWRIED